MEKYGKKMEEWKTWGHKDNNGEVITADKKVISQNLEIHHLAFLPPGFLFLFLI